MQSASDSLMAGSPARPPLLGFAAWSGTGKTTLLSQLLPVLKGRGLRVGVIKHAHHDFDIDHPGKDSHTLRKAGADTMLVCSSRRWALMVENPDKDEPRLAEVLERLPTGNLDLVLVEGFKYEAFPKIELHRPSLQRPLMSPQDDHIIAVATDAALEVSLTVPLLDLDDTAAIAEFIIQRFLPRRGGPGERGPRSQTLPILDL